MSTFNVPITRISSISPIEGADTIELAQVFGYQSVVRKGEFTVGGPVVYIPEASIVPEWILVDLGLVGKLAGPQQNRVKAVKLRGCISQGLLLPTVVDYQGGLPFGICCIRNTLTGEEMFGVENQDVSSFLGITKYEPPIPTAMSGEVCNLFGHTVKFDIENYQRYPTVFTPNDIITLTEKLHGTFCCIAYVPKLSHPELLGGNMFAYSKGLGSQGLVFKNNEANINNVYQRVLIEYQQQLHEIVDGVGDQLPVYVMGEIFGPGIQDGFSYGVKTPEFRVFDVYRGDPDSGKYLSENEVNRLCEGRFNTVPRLYVGPFNDEVVKQHRDGQTLLGGVNIREGVVIRLAAEGTRSSPEIGRIILKALSPAYLARKGGTEYT